jgi:hypothetical protein
MSKDKIGDDRAHYEGPDAAHYEQSGGRITGSPSIGGPDDGFGTPHAPGVRGEAYGKPVPTGRSIGGRNSMIDQFISRKKGKG